MRERSWAEAIGVVAFVSSGRDGIFVAEHPSRGIADGQTQSSAIATLKLAISEQLRREGSGVLVPEWESALMTDRCIQSARDDFEAALALEMSGRRTTWQRIFRGRPEIRISGIEDMDFGGFFRGQRLLRIHSQRRGLVPDPPPSFGSWGLFWFDRHQVRQVRYINHSVSCIQDLFRASGQPVENADPGDLADLFASALGRKGGFGHRVVDLESVELLTQEGYSLNRVELERVAPSLLGPTIVTLKEGWELRFSTLAGWMHRFTKAVAWRVSFSHQFVIGVRQQLVSRVLFSGFPEVVY